jgi:hypothetical protein
MSQPVKFDLYDHNLSFWFRNFTLAEFVEAAMLSADGDKLELRLANWTYPQIDQATEAVTPVCGISPALALADEMEKSL